MRRIILGLLLALCLVGAGSAYLINFNAPDTIMVGEPFVVTGTSTLPPGFSTEVIFYTMKPTAREIARKTITIQEGGRWVLIYNTEDLTEGTYKFEIQEKSAWEDNKYVRYEFGSSSDTLWIFDVIDRSDDLTITSSLTQKYSGFLDVSGSIQGHGDKGVQITVENSTGTVFGPVYIPTDPEGGFSVKIPISGGGRFIVTFKDTRGFIGTKTFTVVGDMPPSPESTSKPPLPQISASAGSSRDAPAYFVVDTVPGEVTITTSTGVDWVLEYIGEDTIQYTVNEEGTVNPERAMFQADGGEVYVKVYPVAYTITETVMVYAQGAEDVREDPSAAIPFGETPRETPTAETPLPLILPILAVLTLCLVKRR